MHVRTLSLLLLLSSYNSTYKVHTARQNSENTNNELISCYKINQCCNSRLIQMKDTREIQVTVSQFQQFRHKASSNAFISRESTFIIGCEKTSRQRSRQTPNAGHHVDNWNNIDSHTARRLLKFWSQASISLNEGPRVCYDLHVNSISCRLAGSSHRTKC